MTDLTKMWETLAKYQPYADADGHGESWRKMCEKRTEKAAYSAYSAAADAAADAAGAAAEAAYAGDVMRWSTLAVERIEAALKECEPVPSNIEPTSNDDGQAQTVDAQRNEIEQLKSERDALKADAERYRYLRIHCYRYRWPNNEHDREMQLSFTVSGIWANNRDPEVLDGCIDTARGVKTSKAY